MKTSLKPGDPAPGFTATAVGGIYGLGAPVSLHDFAGQPVVLYFYPRDDTPGCTRQACGLRDGWSQVSQRAVVLGVSPDSVPRHQGFIAKYNLPFPLVSDESKAICGAYGVTKPLGVERSTFIVGADGKLRNIFRKVKPVEHLELVLAALE